MEVCLAKFEFRFRIAGIGALDKFGNPRVKYAKTYLDVNHRCDRLPVLLPRLERPPLYRLNGLFVQSMAE
jgi:hypothetical protein